VKRGAKPIEPIDLIAAYFVEAFKKNTVGIYNIKTNYAGWTERILDIQIGNWRAGKWVLANVLHLGLEENGHINLYTAAWVRFYKTNIHDPDSLPCLAAEILAKAQSLRRKKRMKPSRPKRINKQLEVGWDADHDPGNPKDWKLLLTTRPDQDDHEHFELTQKQALDLYNWIGRFLEKTK